MRVKRANHEATAPPSQVYLALNLHIVAFSFKTLVIRKFLYLSFYFSDQSQEIAAEVICHIRGNY